MSQRPLWVGISALVLTGLAATLYVKSATSTDAWKAYDYYIGALTGLGCALSICLGFHSPRQQAPGQSAQKISQRWLMLAAVSASIAVFTRFAGMRQFSGFDCSALIDTPWRMVNGQRPYLDFPCSLPVGFYLGAYHAFRLGGVSWSSLVLLNSIFAVVTFLWSAGLIFHILGSSRRSLVVAIFLQCCTTVFVSYWWYNPITTVAGSVFFLSTVCWIRTPRSFKYCLSWTASLFLLANTKPNIAGPLIIASVLVILGIRPMRRRVMVASAVAFLAFVGVLAHERIHLADLLRGYFAVAQRGFSWAQFLQDLGPFEKFGSLALLAALAAPLFALQPRTKRLNQTQIFVLLTFCCGLYGFATNGESKLVDIPIMMLAVIVWANEATAAPAFPPRRPKLVNFTLQLQNALLILLIVLGLGLGWSRHRVKLAGPGAFFEFEQLRPIENLPFFKTIKASPALYLVVAETTATLRVHPARRVFFGPRMQWAYAAMGCLPPANEPSWWHSGVSYKAEDSVRLIKNWQANRHDLVILLKNDYTYIPVEIIHMLRCDYIEEPGITISVFTPKITGANSAPMRGALTSSKTDASQL